MALVLPLYIFWFPAGLFCLLPRHTDVSPSELVLGWMFYFAFTLVALNTPRRTTFKALLLGLAVVLALNMIGCYRVLR